MNTYARFGEVKRTLQADDIAILLFAALGLDEEAGTSDDYGVLLQYQGRTTSGCDVIVEDLDEGQPQDAGFCTQATIAVGVGVAEQHFRIAGVSRIGISTVFDWYYPEVFGDDFESGDTQSWSEESP